MISTVQTGNALGFYHSAIFGMGLVQAALAIMIAAIKVAR